VVYNGATQTIINSFNVASVTYNSTGNYTVNFYTPLNTNPMLLGSAGGGVAGEVYAVTPSALNFTIGSGVVTSPAAEFAPYDFTYLSAAFFS
jgi:hypothetical protein